MNKVELEKIKDSIEFKMVAEQNTGYRNEYSPMLQEEIALYNEVINLKQKIEKAIDKLYCWGEALNPTFQQEMLSTLKGENNEKNDD